MGKDKVEIADNFFSNKNRGIKTKIMEVYRNSFTVENNQLIITLPSNFKAREVDAIILPSEKKDWYDDLTIEQKKSIERGRAEIKTGRGIPHEEVKKRIRKIIGQIDSKQ